MTMALKDFFRALFANPVAQAARAQDELARESKKQAKEQHAKAMASFKRFKDALDTPVIFANGVDIDLPGLEAALQNLPVWYDGRCYAPGESVIVQGRILTLPCHGWVWHPEGAPTVALFDPRGQHSFSARYVVDAVAGWKAQGRNLHVTKMPANPGRELLFVHSMLRFAAEVEP